MMGYISGNYLAILVTAVVAMVISMVWYSPKVFLPAWLKAIGMTRKKFDQAQKKGMGSTMLVNFLSTLVMVYVLSWFIVSLGATGFFSGMVIAFWAWVGFMVPLVLGSVLWEGKDTSLFFINGAHWLVVLLVSGGILAVWA